MILGLVPALPVVLAAYREQRILRRFATTPAKPRDLLVAQYVIHGAAAIVGGALAVVVGRFAYGAALPRNAVGPPRVSCSCSRRLSIGGLIGGCARTAKLRDVQGAGSPRRSAPSCSSR